MSYGPKSRIARVRLYPINYTSENHYVKTFALSLAFVFLFVEICFVCRGVVICSSDEAGRRMCHLYFMLWNACRSETGFEHADNSLPTSNLSFLVADSCHRGYCFYSYGSYLIA